jgi:hypothetical protein
MLKHFKKVTLSLLSALVVLFSLAPFFQAKAVGININLENAWSHTWYAEQNPFAWYQKVYDKNTSPDTDIFGERYTAAQVQWVIYGVFSFFWNFIPGNPELTTCLMGGDMATCMQKIQDIIQVGRAGGSNLASTPVGALSFLGQNPISSVAYFKDVAGRFSLVSTAKAQGFGYSTAGNSMIALWRITRNLSYGFMILAVVVLAFMIMFRVKISPQVIITVQSALPKVVIALILITFSYAIAGLLVDLMYVVIGLLATALYSGGLSGIDTPLHLFQDFTQNYSVLGLLYIYWMYFVVAAIFHLFTSLNNVGVGILGLVLAILSILIILWWSIKIVWVLIKNFVMIMLTIAIGPLEILMGTVNGSMGFGSWIKKLISYLAVYPVMCLLFFLSFFFLFQGTGYGQTDGSLMPFSPSLNLIGTNTWEPPLSVMNSSGTGLIWLFVSFFIFSEITKVTDMIQAFIAGKPFAYGSGIGEATGAAKFAWGQTGGPILEGARRRAFESGNIEAVNKLAAKIEGVSNKIFPKKGVKDSTA